LHAHGLIDEVRLGLGERRTGQLLRRHIGQHAGRAGQAVEVRLNPARQIVCLPLWPSQPAHSLLGKLL